MPITSFTIAGEEVNPLFDRFEINETVGGISNLSCDIVSVGSPVQRFAIRQEVIVQEDGVRIFAGFLKQVRERGYGGPNIYDADTGAPQIVTEITADDYTRLADRVFVTEDVAEGTTLKDFLTTLVDDYFDQFGVTLHPSQATGPSLPAMTFDRKRGGSEVLQALTDATGYLWRIDYDKQLRMWQEGDLAAPFDIDEFDDPPRWTDDVEVEVILGDNFANRVTVVMEPVSESGRVESFPGDGVTDTFTLAYTLTRITYGVIHLYELDGVTPAGAETIGIVGTSPVQWEYDPVTNQITRLDGPTDATKIYKLTFDGTFSASATAEDAADILANGLYEYVERRNDIPDAASAQALADSLLAERLGDTEQMVGYKTRFSAPTLRAGQQQGLAATARDISGDFIVRDLKVNAETPATAIYAAADVGLIRSVTAKKQRVLVGKWQHTYRDWLKVGSGASATTTTTPVSSGAAPPVRAVQFNRSGGFGGKSTFTFYEDFDSVAVGVDSDITAASVSSSLVWGTDCHIEDP